MGIQKEKELSKRGYLFKSISGIVIFFTAWTAITYTEVVKPFFLPSPLQVINSIAVLFIEHNLLSSIGVSVYRISVGFVLALSVALPLGTLIGTIKSMEAFIEPLVDFIRYVPVSAFVPLSILWFGIGDLQKFFIIFIGTAPYLLILVADIVANVKNEFIDAGYTLGATKKQIYTKVIIPYSLPAIWDATRLIFGAAWALIILVEIVAATSGLGYVIVQSQRFLLTANVIGIVIVIGMLGLFTDYLFKAGYRIFFPWSEKR